MKNVRMEDCTLINDTDKQNALYAMGSLGVAATIVCFVAASLVFIFKLYKSFAHRLALYQVSAGFFYGLALAFELAYVSLTVPKDEKGPGCEIIGFSILYFSWVKLMFTSWVVLHLFCFSVFYKNLQNLEILFVFISVLFPLLFSWAPFLPDEHGVPSYGSAGAWCWIRNWRNDCIQHKFIPGIGEQLGLWYVPAEIFSIIDSIAIVVIISRLICCRPKDEEITLLERGKRMKALKELLPLLVYPILYCILLIPPFANRIYGAASNKLNITVIVISGGFVPLQPLCAGLALFIHVCVLKCSKCIRYFRKRRKHQYTALTFASEKPSTWRFTSGGGFSTRDMTQADIPNESEDDNSVLARNKAGTGTRVLRACVQ